MKKLLLAMSLTGACTSFAYAEESLLSKCTTVKNAKQRLACYDMVAPEAIKQLSESIASSITKDNAEEEGVMKEQQKLVRDTLRELRKLSTATEVGISMNEYSRRVTDVASDVQLNLPEIKNASVRSNVKDALQAFVDANDLWRDMASSEYVSWFFEHYGNDAAKYGVNSSVYSDYNGTFMRQGGMSPVLSPVWSFAKKSIDQADAASTK